MTQLRGREGVCVEGPFPPPALQRAAQQSSWPLPHARACPEQCL